MNRGPNKELQPPDVPALLNKLNARTSRKGVDIRRYSKIGQMILASFAYSEGKATKLIYSLMCVGVFGRILDYLQHPQILNEIVSVQAIVHPNFVKQSKDNGFTVEGGVIGVINFGVIQLIESIDKGNEVAGNQESILAVREDLIFAQIGLEELLFQYRIE